MTRRTPGRTAGVDNRRSTRSPFVHSGNTPITERTSSYTPPAATRRKGQLPSRNTGQIQFSGSGPYFMTVTGPSGRQQNSLAEQREAGAAVGLTFEHFDPVDVAFDHA